MRRLAFRVRFQGARYDTKVAVGENRDVRTWPEAREVSADRDGSIVRASEAGVVRPPLRHIEHGIGVVSGRRVALGLVPVAAPLKLYEMVAP